MLKSRHGIIFCLLTLSACGAKLTTGPIPVSSPTNLTPEDTTIEGIASKIIGASNLLKVRADGSNLEAPFRDKLDAFGFINISETPTNGGAGTCTTTHIGNGYAITAGHCFFDDHNLGDLTARDLPCPEIKVTWGYRAKHITSTSTCKRLIFAERSKDRDFAIIALDSWPSVSIPVSLDTKQTAPNTKISILGFPNERPLEWSQYCALRKASVVPGLISDSQFAYKCDTEGGNSGSAVLAINSRKELKIIGIHNGSVGENVPFNYATYVFDINSALITQGINIAFMMNQSLFSFLWF